VQALGLAWDTRPKEQGGQRWFHLYPDEKIAHDDELHWTKPSQNWNSMCAECHSTNLQKNYDPASRSFSTSWSEIDVSCEACHGPGASHVSWAEKKPGWEKHQSDMGLSLLLDERKGVTWSMDPETGSARRDKPRNSEKEIEMCARCHARRSPITRDYVHGDRFMDHYLARHLDQGMYFADGQMDDEVYVYGSFLQSKMYHAGVTCSDCHEPHSLDLKAPGNGVCLQCHQADKYDTSGHHFHEAGSPGASCAECHMPPRDYMVVDPRHDHSMRIPRPDLSVKLGTPNACNQCHQDKSSEWAATRVSDWYGHAPEGFQAYALALHAARNQEPAAGGALAELIRNAQTPDIARATALAGIGPYLSRTTADVLAVGLADSSPLLRAAVPTALEAMPPNAQVRLAWPMLSDPVRAVRIEAARLLAAIPAGELPDEQRAQLDRTIDEYIESQLAMAERPEAQINLGNLYAARGEADKAVSAYLEASTLDPMYVPAYVNLADLYRSRGDEVAAEKVLRQAAGSIPDNGDLHYALGLSLIRQKRAQAAVEELRLAARLNPDSPRYIYVYAVALNSTGQPQQAIMVLQGAHNSHPDDVDILNALIAFHRDAGNHEQAKRYAQKLKLKRLSP
jgi:tetratricopeptide (TPR) repeat protein